MTALTPAQQAKLRDVLGNYYGQADWLVDDVIERMADGAPDLFDDDGGVRPPEGDPEMPDDPIAQDARCTAPDCRDGLVEVVDEEWGRLMPSTSTDCARCEGRGVIPPEETA